MNTEAADMISMLPCAHACAHEAKTGTIPRVSRWLQDALS